MKNILVPTDFSLAASNAARYALHLASPLKANILLCNAMLIPIEAAASGQVAWPLEDYNSIKKDTTEQLHKAAKKLEHKASEAGSSQDAFQPSVSYTSEVGTVKEVIQDTIAAQNGSMVVMGLSGAGSAERFFMGSSSRDLIADATFPVLLIPPAYIFNPVKVIAFATDLNKGDINILHTLAGFAKKFDAEIRINHISDDKSELKTDSYKADVFMAELCSKISYPKISYHQIKNMDVDHGLNQLNDHGQVDMLAIVHRQHSFLASLFLGSHTQKLARHITVPLLVFPPEYGAAI
jgi:nucleotide-binding universal stress UspA family protein